MNLTLQRVYQDGKRTIGRLTGDVASECDTLEDDPAIPAGTYETILNYSNRFSRVMPLLLNVPEYTGIRIHAGNTEVDTTGCILVGTKEGTHLIKSRLAFSNLLFELQKANMTSKVFITIKDVGQETL